ncbi:hypothetical protein RhiirC2_857859 [Rhizophagus irregularis]|uniref:Uncharacterized protein n=1 Tax=Rhizophagus irregularis TaxID=588596 RepID=A0A2N1M9G4_9GLOM|nr:hypothetical protein RhiirC2_857859 [Rhizophagus irregularis]
MKNLKIKPNIETDSIGIRYSENLKKAKRALNIIFQSDFKPTINDYNHLIRAAGKSC